MSVQPFSDLSVLQIPTKPPTKEPTEPIDHVLHSDVRVVRRVKFDTQVSCPLRCSLVVTNSWGLLCNGCLSILQVAERNSFMEEVKLERERQQKVCCLLSIWNLQHGIGSSSSCSGARNKAIHGTMYSCAVGWGDWDQAAKEGAGSKSTSNAGLLQALCAKKVLNF